MIPLMIKLNSHLRNISSNSPDPLSNNRMPRTTSRDNYIANSTKSMRFNKISKIKISLIKIIKVAILKMHRKLCLRCRKRMVLLIVN